MKSEPDTTIVPENRDGVK